MIYCKQCKISAKPTDPVCPKCGGPLSTFGAASGMTGSTPGRTSRAAGRPSSSGTTAAPAGQPPRAAGPRPRSGATGPASPVAAPPQRPFAPQDHAQILRSSPGTAPATGASFLTLGGQIEEAERVIKKNQTRGLALGLLSLAAVAAIFLVIYQVYARTVLDYAVLRNVVVRADTENDRKLLISYDAETTGKVTFFRSSGPHLAELVILIHKPGHSSQQWTWAADARSGIDFQVRYRNWLLPAYTINHFDVSRSATGLDVVFLIDSGGHWPGHLSRVREGCSRFVEAIRARGLNCNLGAVCFGDLRQDPPISTVPLTGDVAEFRSALAGIATAEGEGPRPVLEAISMALTGLISRGFERNRRIGLVVVTEAPCHDAGEVPKVVEALNDTGVIVSVASTPDHREVYEPLCLNGGKFFALRATPFDVLLSDVASSMTDEVDSQ